MSDNDTQKREEVTLQDPVELEKQIDEALEENSKTQTDR